MDAISNSGTDALNKQTTRRKFLAAGTTAVAAALAASSANGQSIHSGVVPGSVLTIDTVPKKNRKEHPPVSVRTIDTPFFFRNQQVGNVKAKQLFFCKLIFHLGWVAG
jgi:hypothetical protein